MDPTKIGYFSKLFIEDDEKDLVRFSFPDHQKKIKCHKSILVEKSVVFKTMFGDNWTDNGVIEMDDNVDFDQYEMFKTFIELVYEIRDINTLILSQATAVLYYSHKYDINDVTDKISALLNEIVESGMTAEPFHFNQLQESLAFAEMYQLKEFKEKQDLVTLALDDGEPHLFFELAKKYEMVALQEQIIEHLKTVKPNDDWTNEISQLVVKRLQEEIIRNRIIFQKEIVDIRNANPYQSSYRLLCRKRRH